MRSFRKSILKMLCFLLCVIFVSSPFIMSYIKNGTHGKVDRAEMKAMTGSVDTVAVGDSQLFNCFIPYIFDEELGSVSYNASSIASSIRERYTIIKSYIDNHPIQRVILDLSYNALGKNYTDAHAVESVLYAFDQVIDDDTRIDMLLQNKSLPEYYSIYKYMMFNAFLNGYLNVFEKFSGEYELYKKQGFIPSYDGPFVPDDDAADSVGSIELSSEPLEENMIWIDKLFELCAENDIELIIVTTPVSEQLNSKYKNPQTGHDLLAAICAEHGVLYIDFNDAEHAGEFRDNALFGDENHMNIYGAIRFTHALISALKS